MPKNPNYNQGRLLIIGAHEERNEDSAILRHFVEMSGDKKARIILCAAASNEPDELIKTYTGIFKTLGAAEVHQLAFEDRMTGEDETLLKWLEQATAVFFTGGDQLRLVTQVAGTRFGERLVQKMHGGKLLIAGTSAGAAAMGSTMIVSGAREGTVRRSDVVTEAGLSLWNDSVIDTHFNQRGRVPRLITIFAHNPQILGIGLDEDTAINVQLGKSFTVLGSGAVTVFDGRVHHTSAAEAKEDEVLAVSGMQLHVLPRGYGFDLKNMKILKPDEIK
jgi:cyanophycinase